MLQKLSNALFLAHEKDSSLTLSSDSSDVPATQDFSELLHSQQGQQGQQEQQGQPDSNGQSQPADSQSIDAINVASSDDQSLLADDINHTGREPQLIADAETYSKLSIDLSVDLEQQTTMPNLSSTKKAHTELSDDELQMPSDAETFYSLMQGMQDIQPKVTEKDQVARVEGDTLTNFSAAFAVQSSNQVDVKNTLIPQPNNGQANTLKAAVADGGIVDTEQLGLANQQFDESALIEADIRQLLTAENTTLTANQFTVSDEKAQVEPLSDDQGQLTALEGKDQQILPLPVANEIVSQWNREFQASSPTQQQQMLSSIKQVLTSDTGKNNPVGSSKSASGVDGLMWSEQKQILALDMTEQELLAQAEIVESDAEVVPRVSGTVSQVLADVARSLNLSGLAGAERGIVAGVGDLESVSPESFRDSLTNISNNRLTTPEKTAAVIDMTRPNANQKLAETVNVMLNSKHLFADIRLDPADLGMMQVRITMNGEQANINFVVQSQQTQAMIEQSTQRLRDILQSQGVNVGETTVSQDDQPFSQQSKGQQGDPDGRAEGADDSVADHSEEDDNIQNISVLDDGRIDDFA